MGLLAGSVLPLVAGIFTVLGQEPLIIGGAFAAYLLSSLFLGKVPPIFAALVVALVGAAVLGRFGSIDGGFRAPIVEPTLPVFSWESILTVTPVLVVLIVLQANVPSLVFLRSQDYSPPVRVLDFLSGIGTMAGSLLGPVGVPCPCPLQRWWPDRTRAGRNTGTAQISLSAVPFWRCWRWPVLPRTSSNWCRGN
ncbi:Benzoate membrane transport protein [Arthrobacter sp. VKM Ac-2550]|nr:Benzoate membrane transport protein [Arthrobacter sp. VKM Ac-2550]